MVLILLLLRVKSKKYIKKEEKENLYGVVSSINYLFVLSVKFFLFKFPKLHHNTNKYKYF